MAHHEPLPPPPRRRRRRHWARRLLIAFIVLIVLAVVSVQIVLWSPLPKRIAESQVQKELGAQAKIESVDIGWLGTTHAKGITLTLPLARTPIVQIREMTIRHDSLPVIAFTHGVRSITADGVAVDLRQDREGDWNVEQLLANRPPDEGGDSPSAVLDLPNLTAADVTVKVLTNDGRTAELRNVNISGIRKPPLDYVISANVGDELHANGRMALTRDVNHEFTVKLTHVPDALQPLFGKLPEPLRAHVTWEGRRTDRGIDGLLHVKNAAAGDLRATGDVELFTWENKLVAAPKSLAIHLLEPVATTRPATTQAGTTQPTTRQTNQIVLDGGRILFGDRIGLQRLKAQYVHGRFAIDGYVDRRTYTADVTAAWDEIAEAGLGTSGQAKVKLTRDLTGELAATADIHGSVDVGGRTVAGAIRIRGGGDSPETLFADIETDAVTLTSLDGQQLAIPAIEASLRANGREIKLASFRPRDPSLGEMSARGSFNIDSKFWFAAISARGLKLSDLRVPGVTKPLDLDLDSFGTAQRLDVKDFYLRHGGAMYWSRGFYDSHQPDPVSFKVWAWYTLPRQEDDTAAFRGLRFQGDIAGTLSPRDLYASGSVRANDLQVRGRHIGDISALVKAHWTKSQLMIDSPEDIDLLGGRWKLHGLWVKDERGNSQPLIIRVDWTELPVNAIADAAKLTGLNGIIDAGTATVILPNASLRDMRIDARASGRNLRAGPTGAEKIDITAKFDSGTLTADVKLNNGKGTIVSKVETSILEPSPVTVTASLTEWPTATAEQSKNLRDLQAYVSGQLDVSFLPESKRLNAKTKLAGRIERAGNKVGDFDLTGSSENRKLTLESLKLRTLDGSSTALGSVDLDDINGANFDATYNRLDLTQLAWLVPALKDVTGRYNGELHIHPATDRRPLGPIGITLNIAPIDGKYRTIDLGDIELTAFASYEGPRDYRFVTDKAIVHMAGGEVQPFLRLSSTSQYGLTQLINLDVKDLNLEPMVHAFKEDDKKPMPGLVNGSIRLYGSLRSVSAINGEADIRLTKSDLVNYKPVAFLYNLMRVGTAGSKPLGEGRINFRMEQAILRVNSARYFNRGIEITAFGPISELDRLGDATMGLILVGSARPLKDVKLPFFGDADQILTVLQGTVTTVQVKGTVREPKPEQVFINQLGEAFKGVLLGIVKDDTSP